MMNKTNTYNNKILYFLDILEHYFHYLNYFTYTSSLSLISFDVFLNYRGTTILELEEYRHIFGFFFQKIQNLLIPFYLSMISVLYIDTMCTCFGVGEGVARNKCFKC